MTFFMSDNITDSSISDLKPWKSNARTHSKKQIKQLAKSIKTFGFTNPVLIDNENNILAGHGRVLAARQLGMKSVPSICIEHLSADQKRAYVLADNKLALNAGWDEELLALELGDLIDNAVLDFDLDVIGFSEPEIDSLLQIAAPEEPGDPADDAIPNEADTITRVQTGDIWQLGSHRLICGNALDPEIISKLMDNTKAGMVITDPPYNVPINGHVGGSGKTKHREFAMASGEMSSMEFTNFLEKSFKNLCAHSIDGSIHFVFMDWRHISELLAAGQEAYTELKNMIVWAKDNGGMGTFYRSRHELIFVFKYGRQAHMNNFELGQYGRYRTNVWEYRGVNTLKTGRMDELALHPTVKPVQMLADAIRDVSSRGDIVLDIFGGSGSTLIAAHKTGRRGYLCEIDPIYCDRILARYERYAYDEAKLFLRADPVCDNLVSPPSHDNGPVKIPSCANTRAEPTKSPDSIKPAKPAPMSELNKGVQK